MMKHFSILSLFLFAVVVAAPALVAAYLSDEMNPKEIRYYKISIPERRLDHTLFLSDGVSFQRDYRQTLLPFISRSSVNTPTRRYPRTNFITPQRKSFSIRHKADTQLPLIVRQRNIRKRSLFRYERASLGY